MHFVSLARKLKLLRFVKLFLSSIGTIDNFFICQIVADCSTPSTRWILLETPRPEELVIAALRIRIIRESTVHALVDILGSARSTAIRNIILIRAEAICRSLGCFKITIEVPSWSEDIQEWLSTCGYEDLGQ